MEGQEGLLRAYGLREVATGMLSLSIEKTAKRGSRIAGAKSVRATHHRRGLGIVRFGHFTDGTRPMDRM